MKTTKNLRIVMLVLLIAAVGCKKGGGGGGTKPNPVVSINSLTQAEGNAGTTAFGFVVKLSSTPSQPVTVTYSTLEGGAKAGDDFAAVTNQAITFQANETEKSIIVNVVADETREGDDDFTVMLTGATNATIQQFTAIGTITNDDLRVTFTNTGYDAPASYPGYTIWWQDEFNTGTLNTSSWTFENGDGCPNVCGWGNNELEYYKPENLFFQDGKMLIEAKKESFGGKNYTSSKILTRDKKVFKFGRIDIRAKLPKGKGIWPAFWLLPQSNVFGGWPRSGEIDLMEMIGHEPGRTYATLHFGPGPGSTQISRNFTLAGGAAFYDEFHVFSIEWKQDQIKWFVDGNLFSTVNKSDLGAANYPFNEDFFFIINLAVGGNWPGSPDANTYFPQWLIVDYIRVYQ
ncbi:MAG: family 16 glycosylhydrolase [Chitinophagaceae bacterium]|nr:family 16 glycosylhydrolase [Chitinophagaceae bacterium]